MESYLRQIVKEYEDNLRKFKGEPPSLSLSTLNKLCEFMYSDNRKSGFYVKFVDKYHLALNSIRSDMLSGDVK